jgi:hypothetical protein
MAELMLGQPLFPGESGIDQLVEIIKVLGTPTREQIRTMNPNYMEHKFPQIKPHPFSKVRGFQKNPPQRLDLTDKFYRYLEGPTQLLWSLFQNYLSILQLKELPLWTLWFIHFSMNSETQIRSFPILATPMLQTRTYHNCSTSLVMVCIQSTT